MLSCCLYILLIFSTASHIESQSCNPFIISNVKSKSESSSHNVPVHGHNSEEYVIRAESYINMSLEEYTSASSNTVLNAFRGQEISGGDLQPLLDKVASRQIGHGFTLLVLLRILHFDNRYEAEIHAAVNNVYFWLTVGDNTTVWWTENNAIIFMSSHFLFNQRYGGSGFDSVNLRQRLVHWLRLKIQYHFYEFYSKVYGPNVLNSLLNLVDFSKDREIARLSAECARIVLKQLLMVTNQAGASFSVAGRDYWRVAQEASNDKNHNKIVYLLTGVFIDNDARAASTSGAFLSTSTLEISPTVYEHWNVDVDMMIYNGHPTSQLPSLNTELATTDQTLFQWSANAMFADRNASTRTISLWDMYNLWAHIEFKEYSAYKGQPMSTILDAVEYYRATAQGALIVEAEIALFKNKNSMLSSLQSFNVGLVGSQMLPWIASTKTISIWCNVGDISNLPDPNTPIYLHALPHASQSGNILLLGFRPDDAAPNAVTGFDVLFYWPVARWNESITSEDWAFGREEDAFIALRPMYFSDGENVTVGPDRMTSTAFIQVWCVVVGNTIMYGDFLSFVVAVTGMDIAVNTTGGTLSASAQLGGRLATLSFAI